ncbi:MAG TPA: glycosyltransferase family 39 protein [Thermoanaerobaculia bacterium]|jgi:hypothetical protein|nr:glycosyltransferase family 39 protein [Thermoanaerobaculia bacterium]
MPATNATPRRTFRVADFGWLLPPFAIGTVLRLWNVRAQVLAGDEMHAVRVALVEPLSHILTTYELRDNCIPLTALYRLLLEHGVPLSELVVRLPILLSGLLALLALPWVVARRVGPKVGHLFAWLLAVSPLLVFYSRIARPYTPIVLFGFAATAAFEEWWRTGRRRPAALYVVGAALAVWFHLGTAPFVLAPFLFALGTLAVERRWRSQGERPGLAALVGVGAAAAAAILGFLLPARASLLALVSAKHEGLAVSRATLAGVLRLQSGAVHPVAVVLFWAAALYGLVTLARRAGSERGLAAYTATLAASQVAGLLVLSPEMLGHPLVFDRYLLPVLPWLLLWVAVGLAAPWWRRQRRVGELGQSAAAFVLVGALFLAGPLADPGVLGSSFAGHNDFVGFFCPRATLRPGGRLPGFYNQVVRQERGAPVLEYPWIPLWSYNRVFYLYQEVHHRDVLVAMVEPLRRAGTLAFRNLPFTSPEGFLASRARYLIVHTDVLAEEEKVQGHCWPIIAEIKPRHRRELERAGERMARSLTAIWGEPDYREDGLVVWNLARLRRAGAQAGKPIPPEAP